MKQTLGPAMPAINAHTYPLSKLSLLLIVVFSACTACFFVNWNGMGHPFVMDVDQYYSYLYALFVKHNFSFLGNPHEYWLTVTPTGHLIPKVTYGMALLYSPFFFIARLFAGTGSTGYEPVYAWCVHIGCMLYTLTGLWYSRKTLLLLFSELVTALALTLLFFGTNLLYYTLGESEAVHGPLFMLIAVFVYHSLQWNLNGRRKHILLAAFVFGLLVLIRPSEILLGLIPPGICLCMNGTLRSGIRKLLSLRWTWAYALLLFLLPIVPQLIYWKMQTGQFLFFSYGSNEGFFWSDPRIYSVLLGFRKGLFIYSPILVFVCIGFVRLYRSRRWLFYPVLLYTLLNLYVVSAWWDWGYGGAFGMRALVHSYAVLVIPFAAFADMALGWLKAKGLPKIAGYTVALVCTCFCLFNVFQTNLYKHRIIHWDSMTREAYRYVFLKAHYTPAELSHLSTLMKHPDYAAMRRGERDE